MSTAQLLLSWAMLGLAAFGVPCLLLGWWAGRRALRHLLDPRHLPPVPPLHTVELVSADRAPTMPLSMCVEPPLLISEHLAGLDAHEREVRAMIDATAELLPQRWRL